MPWTSNHYDEWLADSNGKEVFEPLDTQMETVHRKMSGGSGEDSELSMNPMDMPLVNVLLFQQQAYDKHLEDIGTELLKQGHI